MEGPESNMRIHHNVNTTVQGLPPLLLHGLDYESVYR